MLKAYFMDTFAWNTLGYARNVVSEKTLEEAYALVVLFLNVSVKLVLLNA